MKIKTLKLFKLVQDRLDDNYNKLVPREFELENKEIDFIFIEKYDSCESATVKYADGTLQIYDANMDEDFQTGYEGNYFILTEEDFTYWLDRYKDSNDSDSYEDEYYYSKYFNH